MNRGGRTAALPTAGELTQHGLLDGGLVVRCFSQDGRDQRDFDFSELPVHDSLRRELAAAFAARTAPGAGLTTINSFLHPFRAARMLSEYIATLDVSPTTFRQLTPTHIDDFMSSPLGHSVTWSTLSRLLQRGSLSDGLAAHLYKRKPREARGAGKSSYTRAEFNRIESAARDDLRQAAKRIRSNRVRLGQYLSGTIASADREFELLEYVHVHGDVPRYVVNFPPGHVRLNVQDWVRRYGSIIEVIGQLHLTANEVFAGVVLMAVMTGQNASVITDMTTEHHRADGHSGTTPTAIIDTHKPRRGRRAYMNLALTHVPDWIDIPDQPGPLSARDELHTPFGLYTLMLELTARTREMTGSNELFIGYHPAGGKGVGKGFRKVQPGVRFGPWSSSHQLVCDQKDKQGEPISLRVALDRIRLTYLEIHQRPVAHTSRTLIHDYLVRNGGNLTEYQQVVATALAGEVNKARASVAITRMSKHDLERALADPHTVGDEFGVDADTMKRMIAGELDTVMAACTDDGTAPYSAATGSCRASFMQCLDCPCARALPHHLPIQVHVYDRLQARKDEMSAADWLRRFGIPHAQLSDLISRHDDVDVDDARATLTDADRSLVERFLNRELDLR